MEAAVVSGRGSDACLYLPTSTPTSIPSTHTAANRRQFSSSDFATQFHQAYYLQLMQEVFAVMTGGVGGWFPFG